MAVIVFSSELQQLTGETDTHSSERIFKDIVADLAARYPKLDSEKLLGMAVAIDGEIIHQPFLEEVADQSELHFLYRISGG